MSFKDYCDALQESLSERLFALLHSFRKTPNGEVDFELASGFVTNYKGLLLFLTVSHQVEEIENRLGSGSTVDVSFFLPNRPKSLNRFHLLKEEVEAFVRWPEIDIAIWLCTDEFINEMKVCDAKYVKLEDSIFSDSSRYLLCGYSAESSVLVEKELLRYLHKGETWARVSRDIGSLAFRTVHLNTPYQIADGKMEAVPKSNNVESVEGMSGGFIVKVDDLECSIVGIQCGQKSVGKTTTKVQFAPVSQALGAFGPWIDQIVEAVKGKDVI